MKEYLLNKAFKLNSEVIDAFSGSILLFQTIFDRFPLDLIVLNFLGYFYDFLVN